MMPVRLPVSLHHHIMNIIFALSVVNYYGLKRKNGEPFFIPWTALELTSDDKCSLVFIAEIFTEAQTDFIKLTGNYRRLTTDETIRLLVDIKFNRQYN